MSVFTGEPRQTPAPPGSPPLGRKGKKKKFIERKSNRFDKIEMYIDDYSNRVRSNILHTYVNHFWEAVSEDMPKTGKNSIFAKQTA